MADHEPRPGEPQERIVYVEREKNGFAVASLTLGIIGVVVGLIPLFFFLAFPLGILALVFGIIAWRKSSRTGRKGMAVSGTILGAIALALAVAGVVIVDEAVDDFNKEIDEIEREFNEDMEDIGG